MLCFLKSLGQNYHVNLTHSRLMLKLCKDFLHNRTMPLGMGMRDLDFPIRRNPNL